MHLDLFLQMRKSTFPFPLTIIRTITTKKRTIQQEKRIQDHRMQLEEVTHTFQLQSSSRWRFQKNPQDTHQLDRFDSIESKMKTTKHQKTQQN